MTSVTRTLSVSRLSKQLCIRCWNRINRKKLTMSATIIQERNHKVEKVSVKITKKPLLNFRYQLPMHIEAVTAHALRLERVLLKVTASARVRWVIERRRMELLIGSSGDGHI